MKIRKLTANEVKFQITVEEEDIPVRGNACATDDPVADKEIEDYIFEELSRGNIAAWCCIMVRATWNGFTGRACLGGNSYQSEEEAIADCGEALKDEALDDLNKEIAETLQTIATLEESPSTNG